MSVEIKKYAFISYNHKDVKIAKWLHRKLESYKLPSEIHNEFEHSRYLRPVFRDEEDLNTGILGDELKKHLVSSKFLIVICSQNSVKSEWVNNEVSTFIELGRIEKIIPYIIDGSSNSGDKKECLPLSLRDYIGVHPDRELLGINQSEIGREKAFVRIVSRMLGVSFDELWKRYERERRRKTILTITSTPIVISLLYFFSVPISLTIELNDDNHHLPSSDDAMLIVKGAEYPLNHFDTIIIINNIPGYFRGRSMPVVYSAKWYNLINTNVSMGWGVSTFFRLRLIRDNSFSSFSGKIVDEEGAPVSGAMFMVEKRVSVTDDMGHFSVSFPVEKQSETKKIKITKVGYCDYIREDECPDTNLLYILRKKY